MGGCTSRGPQTFETKLAASDEDVSDSLDYDLSETAEKAETILVGPASPPHETERSARLSTEIQAPKPRPHESMLTSSRKSQDLGEFLGSKNNPYLADVEHEKRNASRRRHSESVEQITQSIQRIQDSIDETIASSLKSVLKNSTTPESVPTPDIITIATDSHKDPTHSLPDTTFHGTTSTIIRPPRPSASPADSALTQGADFPSLSLKKKKKKDIKDIIYGSNDVSPVFLVKQFEASQSPAYGGYLPGVSLPRSLQRFSASRSHARQVPSSGPLPPSRPPLPNTYTNKRYHDQMEKRKKKKKKKKRKKKKKKKKKKRDYQDFEFLYAEKKSKRTPESSRSRSIGGRYLGDPANSHSNFGGDNMSDVSSTRSRRTYLGSYYKPKSRTVRVKRTQNYQPSSTSSSSTISPIRDFDRHFDVDQEPDKKRTPKLSFDKYDNYTPRSGASGMIYPVQRSLSSDSDRTISSSFGKYKESLFRSPDLTSSTPQQKSSTGKFGPSSRIPIGNSPSDSEEEEKVDESRHTTPRTSSRRRYRSSDRDYVSRSDRYDRYSSRKRSYDPYRSREEERRSNRRQRYLSDQLSDRTFDNYRDYQSASSRRRKRQQEYERRERLRDNEFKFERRHRHRRSSPQRRGEYRRNRHRRDDEPRTGRRNTRRSFDRLRQKYSYDNPTPKKRSPSPVHSPTKGGGNFDSDEDRDHSLSPLHDKPPPRFTEEMRLEASLSDNSISTLEDDTLRRRSVQHIQSDLQQVDFVGGSNIFSLSP